MTAAAPAIRTFDVCAGIAAIVRRYGPKVIAARVGALPRTVENWAAQKATPQARHIVAMLQDHELARDLLLMAGRADLAVVDQALQRIEQVDQALGVIRDRPGP